MQGPEKENIGDAPAHARDDIAPGAVLHTVARHCALEVTDRTYLPAEACRPADPKADRAAASAVQEIGKDMSERVVVEENSLPSLLEQEKLK